MAVFRVECRDQPGVVPVLEVVVGSFVDLGFNDVPAVVHEKDERFLSVPDHIGHLLSCQLEGPVADDGYQSTVGFQCHSVTESCRNGPTDATPLHLDLEPGT